MSREPTADDQRERLKQAITTIRRLQGQVDDLEERSREPIAITGAGCRFPGDVDDPESFWRLLEEGTDAVSEVPADRWDCMAHFDSDPEMPGKMYTLAGGFLRNIDKFDAEFFGISPREASRMDSQHRLLLEVAWEAFERAGIAPHDLSESSTGVFVGMTALDHAIQLSRAGTEPIDAYSLTGSNLNFGPGRLAYVLGLHGPALAIDTACSSSLVAIHLACQSLRTRDCDLAVAGGVNVIASPEQTIAACKARMLSRNGRCKTFDADADGFVRSEGCGLLVLRRLSDACERNEPILAVIRGSAVNQDGPSSGFTVPNRLAQEAVIRTALKFAGLDPCDIDYIEAHGTATPLGDPIEVRALSSVFNTKRAESGRSRSVLSRPTLVTLNRLPVSLG